MAATGATAPSPGGLENHLGGADAPRYRRYQLEMIEPYLGQSVLEVGAGHGEFAAQLGAQTRLILTDTDPQCLQALRHRFDGDNRVTVAEYSVGRPLAIEQPVDTVVALNVLEHIEDDVAALRELQQLLTEAGRVVLWVPAHQALYGEFDRLVGHWRRYEEQQLRSTMAAAGLRVVECRYVNLLGGLAWWLAVRRGDVRQPSRRLVRLYDAALVPTTRLLERVMRPPFGQSILAVGERL
jgi:SAM-dependent methyltransferase